MRWTLLYLSESLKRMGSAWIGVLTYLLFVGGGIIVAGLVLYAVIRGAVLSALRAHAAERSISG